MFVLMFIIPIHNPTKYRLTELPANPKLDASSTIEVLQIHRKTAFLCKMNPFHTIGSLPNKSFLSSLFTIPSNMG